jgi:hypothetical protein
VPVEGRACWLRIGRGIGDGHASEDMKRDSDKGYAAEKKGWSGIGSVCSCSSSCFRRGGVLLRVFGASIIGKSLAGPSALSKRHRNARVLPAIRIRE